MVAAMALRACQDQASQTAPNRNIQFACVIFRAGDLAAAQRERCEVVSALETVVISCVQDRAACRNAPRLGQRV
jgi:hypothetical protein